MTLDDPMLWGQSLNRHTGLMTFGAIVAVADLAGCHEDEGDTLFGRCSPWAAAGGFHWEFAIVRPLARPVPARGWLGLWTPAQKSRPLSRRNWSWAMPDAGLHLAGNLTFPPDVVTETLLILAKRGSGKT